MGVCRQNERQLHSIPNHYPTNMSLAQKITGKLSKEETSEKPPEKALKEFVAVRSVNRAA